MRASGLGARVMFSLGFALRLGARVRVRVRVTGVNLTV